MAKTYKQYWWKCHFVHVIGVLVCGERGVGKRKNDT